MGTSFENLHKALKLYFGFDGFKGGHFYGNEILNKQYYSDEISSKGYGRHNALDETKYISRLLKDNKIKEL